MLSRSFTYCAMWISISMGEMNPAFLSLPRKLKSFLSLPRKLKSFLWGKISHFFKRKVSSITESFRWTSITKIALSGKLLYRLISLAVCAGVSGPHYLQALHPYRYELLDICHTYQPKGLVKGSCSYIIFIGLAIFNHSLGTR